MKRGLLLVVLLLALLGAATAAIFVSDPGTHSTAASERGK
jgi:hypothetical protein